MESLLIVRGASSYYKILQATIYGEHISSIQIQNQRRYCSVLFKEGCYLIIQVFKYSIKIRLDLICGLLFSCKLIEEKALQRKNHKRRLNPSNRHVCQSSIRVVVFCESLNSILYPTLLPHRLILRHRVGFFLLSCNLFIFTSFL